MLDFSLGKSSQFHSWHKLNPVVSQSVCVFQHLGNKHWKWRFCLVELHHSESQPTRGTSHFHLNIVQASPLSLPQQDLALSTKHCTFSLHSEIAEEVNSPANSMWERAELQSSCWEEMTLEPSAVLCLATQSCPTLCDPKDCILPGSSVHGDSPGQNTRVGFHALLQGIFPTQGSNPGLPHCRQILLSSKPPGKPMNAGVGSLSLLQEIFLTQESNPGLLHCKWILYQLNWARW